MGKRWLLKSEPEVYPFAKLVQDGHTTWDGVRNPQARNNLAAMQAGDPVLFYHSGEGREVIGIARVTRTAYPDPTAGDDRWLAVDLAPEAKLARAVTLAEIKAEASLAKIRESALAEAPGQWINLRYPLDQSLRAVESYFTPEELGGQSVVARPDFEVKPQPAALSPI